jgi:GNAT superfamily N-acetyltransferase
MTRPFLVERLAQHERSRFSSGVDALDTYFRLRVGQDERRKVANCFVAITADRAEIAGYYTLSATAIPLTDLPATVTKKLPPYEAIPAALVGRLAVDLRFRDQKLGVSLLADAAARVLSGDMAAYALVVDAMDDNAAGFYRHNGFQPLNTQPLTLFIPIASFRKNAPV